MLSLHSQQVTRKALKDLELAIDSFKQSSHKYSKAYILLTVVLVAFAVIQIGISVRSRATPPQPRPTREAPAGSFSDPLGLYGPNSGRLAECLKRVNPKDP